MIARAAIEARIRAENPDTSLDGGATRIGAGHPDYEALVEQWTDAAMETEAEAETAAQAEAQAAAIRALAAALLEIFASMSQPQRGRTYTARAGLRLALSEGDLAAAREIVLSIPTLDEAEQQIRSDMLALFPS